MKCPQILEVGVYVLGALSPAERDAFERHLGECAVCRDEVADLAVLPGLLGRLDAKTAAAVARDGDAASALLGSGIDAVEQPGRWAGPTAVAGWAGPTVAAEPAAETAESSGDPALVASVAPAGPTAGEDADRADRTAEGVDHPRWAGPTVAGGPTGSDTGGNVVSLLEAAQRRRERDKRRRWIGTAATILVAACLALVVGIGAPRLVGGGAEPALNAMRQVAAMAPVTAEVALQPMDSGTKVIMHCAYKPTASRDAKWDFRLVVVRKSGAQDEEVGSWTARYGDEIQLTAVTRVNRDDIDRIELRFADGTPLLVLTR